MNQPWVAPQKLFRYYRPIDSNLFTEQKLWFSSFADFNDIFEVCPDYQALIPELVDDILRQEYISLPPRSRSPYAKFKATRLSGSSVVESCIRDYPRTCQSFFSEHYKVICFSERIDSLLMWGHYTECHRGFAVEFATSHSMFSPRDCGKVVYEISRPKASKEPNSQMLLRKSPEWAYEDEHRMVKVKSELSRAIVNRNGAAFERFYLPLPMNAIKAVYLGCRITPEHRAALLEPLRAWPHVEKFVISQNPTQFKLDSTRLD